MGRAKDKIDEKKLSSWKLLDDFRQRLAKAQASAPKPEKRPGGPERKLLEEDYFSLMLFGLFNPVIDSMRGLCAASHLKRVQEDVCSRPVSPGSFSEAQGVFDPELLKQVFLELAGEIPTSWGDARLAHLADRLKPVDGTLLPALQRAHSGADAATSHGQTPRQAGHGADRSVHDGLRGPGGDHDTAGSGKIRQISVSGKSPQGRFAGFAVPGWHALSRKRAGTDGWKNHFQENCGIFRLRLKRSRHHAEHFWVQSLHPFVRGQLPPYISNGAEALPDLPAALVKQAIRLKIH